MKKLSRGILIVIEGIDGSGKSTLAGALDQKLQEHGLPVLLTREPGGTPLGKQLRQLVQERTAPIADRAEFLLFAADRAQHADEVIAPQLQQNKLIISDRLGDSSLVYQGFGRGLDREFIARVNDWALGGIKPDRTLFVHIDVDTALERVKERSKLLSAFEQEPREFFTTLTNGFEQLYANRTDVCRLDGTQSPAAVAQHAFDDVLQFLEQSSAYQ